MDKRQKAAARKAAQRAVPMGPCSRCGSSQRVRRHHPSLAQPLVVELLCQRCHTDEDKRAGKWGSGNIATANCQICGAQFLPKRSARNKLCGSERCLKAMGQRSAAKRWSSGPTACTPLETVSSRSRQRSRSECSPSDLDSSATAPAAREEVA